MSIASCGVMCPLADTDFSTAVVDQFCLDPLDPGPPFRVKYDQLSFADLDISSQAVIG